jgi:hypothetical protein
MIRYAFLLAFLVLVGVVASSEPQEKKFRQAWIFQNDRPNRHMRYMFKPVTDTLIEGLRAMGVKSFLTVTEHFRCVGGNDPTAEEEEGCMEHHWLKPQSGDLFVWVGNPGNVRVPFGRIQARGVFTVYYQSEPRRNSCHLTASDGIDEVTILR